MGPDSYTCNSCGITKPVACFSKTNRKCNDCRRGLSKDRANSSVEYFLRARLSSMRQRHKQKEYDGDIVGIEYLTALYEEQRGICALTGIPMHVSTDHSDLSASPDRIDIEKGYIEGNIRLVCARINLMRSSLGDHDLVWWCRAVVNRNGN